MYGVCALGGVGGKMTAPRTQNDDMASGDDDVFEDEEETAATKTTHRRTRPDPVLRTVTGAEPSPAEGRGWRGGAQEYHGDGALATSQDHYCRSHSPKNKPGGHRRTTTREALQMYALENIGYHSNGGATDDQDVIVGGGVGVGLDEDDGDLVGMGYDDGWRSYHYDEVGMDIDIRANMSPPPILPFHHHVQPPFDDTVNHKVIRSSA